MATDKPWYKDVKVTGDSCSLQPSVGAKTCSRGNFQPKLNKTFNITGQRWNSKLLLQDLCQVTISEVSPAAELHKMQKKKHQCQTLNIF